SLGWSCTGNEGRCVAHARRLALPRIAGLPAFRPCRIDRCSARLDRSGRLCWRPRQRSRTTTYLARAPDRELLARREPDTVGATGIAIRLDPRLSRSR